MNFLIEVYHSLIRLLVLNDHHRIMLNKRGLSNETIQMNEYRSLPLSWKDMAGLCLQIFQKFGERIFTGPVNFFV